MFDLAAIKQMWENAWPIISVLLACSIFSGAMILERYFTLSRFDFDRDRLLNKLRKLLSERRKEQAVAHCETVNRPIGRILAFLMDPPSEDRAAGRDHLLRLGARMIRTEAANMAHYVTAL